MVEAPERIWATGSFDRGQYAGGSWNATSLTNKRTDYGEVEYVRADLYKQAVKRAEVAERLAGARVKALDEDDYEEITNAAGIAMRRASRGIRGQIITVQDSFDWWVMKETERRILSALAEPAGEVEPSKWSIPGSTYAGATTTLDASAVREARKFQLGERVTKVKGSKWTGHVVGFYSTALTPIGYAVESETETGSVQIYPEAALTGAKP